MAEFMLDPELGITMLNETDVDDGEVWRSLQDNAQFAELVRWTNDTRPSTSLRHGNLFDRDRYVTPGSIFGQFRVAQEIAEADDVVAGILESTEALTFSKMTIETIDDEDEEDIWQQIAEDINLEARIREMWREDFTVSQFYCAVYWGTRSYKVSGKSDAGIKRKKRFDNLKVPMGISVLDPMKIIPVGNFLFNQERLCYVADRFEYDVIRAVIEGERGTDPIIEQLMLSPYLPDSAERRMLQEDGCPADRLFLLNPQTVFRHTATRPQYKRFADVRMKSVFELLDQKHQLKAMDRAHLLGATNFIVLVKKGSDQMPGKPSEIATLQNQVRGMSRLPLIVGDHRLAIEIITPKVDLTLAPEKYNGIDSRITARLFGMFMTGNYAAGTKGDDSLKLAKIVAKGLESRRHMIRKTVVQKILDPTYEMNDQFTCEPELRFHPKRIALDFDPTFANFLLDLRDRGDLSRESILEEIDYDQYVEYRRRKLEKERYDDTFETTIPYTAPKGTPSPVKQPGSAPANSPTPVTDPKSAGRRQGGVKNGGGAAPGTGQGQAPTDVKRAARNQKGRP